ncbi:MAG: DUF4239 domain-containing protein [Longimicrobiales bacterium]
MPIWVLSMLAVILAVAISVSGLLLVRKLVTVPVLQSRNDVTGFMHAVVGVLYAVLLAFTVLAGWERYDEADDVADHEANALADLYRAAGAYPEEVRLRLRTKLRSYANAVITDEWPELAHGRASLRAWAPYNDLWREYLAFSPGTEAESLWHRQSLVWLGDLGDYRRMRLLRSEAAIPAVLWVVLAVGGIVTVGFSCAYGLSSAVAHSFMTGALAGTLALILVVLSALEHPYRGEIRVEPRALAEVLSIFEEQVYP